MKKNAKTVKTRPARKDPMKTTEESILAAWPMLVLALNRGKQRNCADAILSWLGAAKLAKEGKHVKVYDFCMAQVSQLMADSVGPMPSMAPPSFT